MKTQFWTDYRIITYCGSCYFLHQDEWSDYLGCNLNRDISSDDIRKCMEIGTFPEDCQLTHTMNIHVGIDNNINVLCLFDYRYII